MNVADAGRLTLLETLRAQSNVFSALMLRDIRTRMFGSSWGFVFSVAWPIAHIMIVVVMFSLAGRMPPYGSSMPLWIAIGALPFMVFSYMSRYMMVAILANKPLLYFPAINITDILFSRAIVEVLSAAVVIICVLLMLYAQGVDVSPLDSSLALKALFSCVLLGLGAGTLNGVVVAFAPGWMMGYTLVVILLWITSGVLFVPAALPEQAQAILWWHPVVHVIEWLREAYYEGYNSSILTWWYPLLFGAGLLFLGLVTERLFRGKILS